MTDNAARRLLAHYDQHRRTLPWRATGSSSPDPYRVWLSEVMLQQTTVATVAPRFARFIARWPTIEVLAAAPDEDILGEWAGLGYYARARNLIACAREVAGRGGFPDSEAVLRELPGIGDYTAAAIAAIAFGERAAVVDTNVRRVVARLNALEQPLDSEVRALTLAMTPADRPGDFAQAMMDLGATICRPRAPDCPACPLRADCAALASGRPETVPAATAKSARPQRFGVAYWIERDGALFLTRRPARGLLGGMAALPGPDWTESRDPQAPPPLARIRHAFTHFALELDIVVGDRPVGDGWWQPMGDIQRAGLPTLYRKAIAAVPRKGTSLAA